MRYKTRRFVVQRDKVCQVCGKKGVRGNKLTIHHIKPKSEYPELDDDPDNLILVCRKCHDLIHGM